MKTKSAVILACLSLLPAFGARAQEYAVDPVHSTALFSVQHLGAGYTYGVFNDLSGKLTFNVERYETSTIEMTIKTASVNTFNEARDKHLASADFFDAEKFPEMSFKSTAWKKIAENTFEISGDFTLHGVTKPVTVTAQYTGTGKGRQGETRMGFETSFNIKRSDYGMGGMVPAVGDEVRITVAVEATTGGEKR